MRRRTRGPSRLPWLLAFALPCCALFPSLDDLANTRDASPPVEAGSPVDASADGSDAGAGDGDCPGSGGPSGVRVHLEGGASFCIDSTEVTYAQYQAFLSSSPDPKAQAPECAWNTSFAPTGLAPSSDLPVANINFCDARAFCQWAGKRLCGKLGGGILPPDDTVAIANQSEWMAACSADGTRYYPYGGVAQVDYQPQTCNSMDHSNAAVAAGSMPACQGGYPGIFDLSGNVSEWEDACDFASDAGATCVIRGGDFDEKGDGLYCGKWWREPIDYPRPYIGIRCCSP